MADLSYTVDASDVIVAVGGAWDDSARCNDAEKIVSTQIIGKSLDGFIHGDETRMFVRTMLMSARVLNRPVMRPYRCDSPQRKRFMEMTVTPLDGGNIEVMHQEVHSEPIANPTRMVAAPKGVTGVHTKRCSVCNRLRVNGIWSELDDAVASGHLAPAVAPALRVIYGVCPDCLASKLGPVSPSVRKPSP